MITGAFFSSLCHCNPPWIRQLQGVKQLLILLLVVSLAACGVKDPNDPKFVLAKVDGQKILRGDLNQSIDQFLKSRGGSREQIAPQMMEQLSTQMLEQRIDGILIVNAMKKEHAGAFGEEVEKELKAFKDRFQDDAKYQEILEKLGLNEAGLNQQVEESVAQKFIVEAAQKVAPEIPDTEAQEFYDKNPKYWDRPEMVQARHILVSADEKASADVKSAAKQKIDAARKRVTGGEDFGVVAKEISDDPGSKERGGLLPPFGKGRMVPEFEKTAFATKPGTVSPVFATPYGYHFLQVVNKEEAKKLQYAEVSDQIKKNLQSEFVGQEVQKKQKQLRDEGEVKRFLPEEEEEESVPEEK